MNREENLISSTTRAIASTVREVPPLRLEPAVDELRSAVGGRRRVRRATWQRHWRLWLAPVTAAAVAVAVAVALVLVRHIPNGPAVSPATFTSTGLGGMPRYYVALDPASSKSGAPNGLLVGDTLTGKTIATFAAPADTSFESVSGATDDRTFVALDVAHPGDPRLGQADSWFEVKLTPGAARPATLSYLPIEPVYDVVATAVSASGKELAVATANPAGRQVLTVYSVATGRMLHDWSSKDSPALVPISNVDSATQWSKVTWIDSDRAIAFASYGSASESGTLKSVSLRRLNVSGPRDGDLLADSQVIWSLPAQTGATLLCRLRVLISAPLISADGKTVACTGALTSSASSSRAVAWMLSWVTYRALAKSPAAAKGVVVYSVTKQEPVASSGMNLTLWISPSGSAVVGEWRFVTTTAVGRVQFGVLSHGTFTPLHLPSVLGVVTPQGIAW